MQSRIIKKFVVPLVAFTFVLLSFIGYVYYQNFQAEKERIAAAQSIHKKPDVKGEAVQQPAKLELVVLSHPVFVTLPGSTESARILQAIEVEEGSTVMTGTTGRAELRYPNKSVTRLNFNTTIKVESLKDKPQESLLQLIQGSIWNRVVKLLGKETFQTETDTMVATVRGTAYGMTVEPDGRNKVDVNEGVVAVNIPDETEKVATAEMSVSFNPFQDIDPILKKDTEQTTNEWEAFNLGQDSQWMEMHKEKFTPAALNGVRSETSLSPTSSPKKTLMPELIECKGKNGKVIKMSDEDCRNLKKTGSLIDSPLISPIPTVTSGNTVKELRKEEKENRKEEKKNDKRTEPTTIPFPTNTPVINIVIPTVPPVETNPGNSGNENGNGNGNNGNGNGNGGGNKEEKKEEKKEETRVIPTDIPATVQNVLGTFDGEKDKDKDKGKDKDKNKDH